MKGLKLSYSGDLPGHSRPVLLSVETSSKAVTTDQILAMSDTERQNRGPILRNQDSVDSKPQYPRLSKKLLHKLCVPDLDVVDDGAPMTRCIWRYSGTPIC